MDKSRVEILGVKVDRISMNQAVEMVGDWVKGPKKHYIVTTNPEFIMAAQKDSEFKEILNKSDLSIPDGSRIGWANKVISEKSLFNKILSCPLFLYPAKQVIHFDTIQGVELVEKLCKSSCDWGTTVGFLGAKVGVAKKASECLQKKYPKLQVIFADSGPLVNRDGKEIPSEETRQDKALDTKYQIPGTDILFVAFGQVKQEKWISKNLDNIPVKVAIGVGGSFDEIAGLVPRPPEWVSSMGLKWLFRLITEPWRIKRQLVLPKFVWKVMTS